MQYFYHDNPALREAIDEYFATLAAYNDAHFDGCLSILLLGSLSRGEATWVDTAAGPVMASDIEFFTVYPVGFDRFSEFDAAMDEAAQKCFAAFTSTLFHIDNGYVCRTQLPLMERKLLTFDAMNMGKIVMGEDVRPLLPRVTMENINWADIRDILTHRMFAVLYYGYPLKEAGEWEQYRCCLAKNSLDLMTVLLLHNGQLTSGFSNRLEQVRSLPVDQSIKDYFAYCLSIKLGTQRTQEYTIEQMEALFLQILHGLHRDFRVPFKNRMVNAKFVARRGLGMLKRALKYRHVPMPGHLNRLIVRFEEKQPLTTVNRLDNLVINGYPMT